MIAFILHHRRKLMFLLVLVTLWCGWGMSKINFEFFRALVLPDKDPALLANNAMGDHFGGQQTVMLMVEGPDVLSGRGLSILKDLTRDAGKLAGVQSPQDVASLASLQEFTSDQSGFGVHPFTDNEQDLEARFKRSPFYNRFLVSKDRTAALVVATLGERVYPDPSVATPEFLNTHFEQVSALVQKYSIDGFKIYATGNQLTLAIGEQKLRTEIIVLTGISLLFLLVVFYVSLRSIALTILASTVMISLVWTVGIMGHFGIPLSTTSIYLVIVIVAIGSSYAIHVISTVRQRMQSDRSSGIAANSAIYEISTPLLTVSLTSALGSISLLTFDTPDIRELGVFQALGVTFCYLVAFFVLPAATMYWLRRSKTAHTKTNSNAGFGSLDRHLASTLHRLVAFPLRHPVIAGGVVCVVLALSVVGTMKVNANFVLEKTVPTNSMPRQGYDRIIEKFGDFRIVSIVLQKVSEGTLLSPEGLSRVSELEESLKTVAGAEILPSINTALNTVGAVLFDEPAPLHSQERIDQTLLLVGKRKLRKLIDASGTRAMINLALDTKDPRQTSETIKNIRAILDRTPTGYVAHLGGGPIVVNSLNHYMVLNKVQSIIMCFVVVFALCALVNSSLKLGLVCVIPATLAAIATFGLMGFLGIDLDIGTATISTIAIGVGTDFAVHFLLQFRSELSEMSPAGDSEHFSPHQYADTVLRTTRHFGPVIFFDACSNIIGFAPLLFSTFPILKLSGGLLMLNQAIVITMTFFCMPLLILIFKPDFPKRAKKELAHEFSDRLV